MNKLKLKGLLALNKKTVIKISDDQTKAIVGAGPSEGCRRVTTYDVSCTRSVCLSCRPR